MKKKVSVGPEVKVKIKVEKFESRKDLEQNQPTEVIERTTETTITQEKERE